jgi:hypothetical protein
MSSNLKDLKELALELPYIGGQVLGRNLEILEKARGSSEYKTCPYTEYIGFLRCSAIASAVKVFPTPGLLLELYVSIYQKTLISILYYKRIIMPRPFLSTTSLNLGS